MPTCSELADLGFCKINEAVITKMFSALIVYVLCGLSGILVERHFAFNSLTKRVMVLSLTGAAQLMFSIQVLSLWKQLTGSPLIWFNFVLTGAVFVFLTAGRHTSKDRLSWRSLLEQRVSEFQSSDPLSRASFFVAVALFLMIGLSGAVIIPHNDSYHFEMPLFWIQHHTVLPFPVHNPRIVALSFLSEALQLPSYLYAHLGRTPGAATLFSGLLVLAVIFSLARRAGASCGASLCAAAITVAYTAFVITALQTGAEMYLAGAWFGGSLLFLMDACASRYGIAGEGLRDIGWSVFSFVMACGAKNTTILLVPLYLPFFAVAVISVLMKRGKLLAKGAQDQVSANRSEEACFSESSVVKESLRCRVLRVTLSIFACGIAGLICSGVGWNYVSNRLWFGSRGLPRTISATVSRDFHPQAVWTRLCRGAVLMAYDTIWLPRSARSKYVSLCEATVKALGGKKELVEDDDYYYFKDKAIVPSKGLGLLGIAFFLPGLLLACSRCLRSSNLSHFFETGTPFSLALLVLMTLGSFFMCHLVLRWQSIGMLRLMFPFVVAGAPLAAFLLEKRRLRIAAVVLLVLSGAIFLVFSIEPVFYRLAWTDSLPYHLVTRLQSKAMTIEVQYRWKGDTVQTFQMRDVYSYGEIYQKLLQGIRQSCTIGFVGDTNSECYFLFGKKFQNRLVPLVDARSYDRILEPPADLDYIVAADRFLQMGEWAQARGFEQIFEADSPNGVLVMAFQKRVSIVAAQPGVHSVESQASSAQ